MSTPITIKPKIKELILRYRNKHPYLSNTKLAALIVMNEKVDLVPDQLRHYIPLATAPKKQPIESINGSNDYELPESDYVEWKPFLIPKSVDNVLGLFDIHFPYQYNPALKAALDYGKDRGVNGILLGGDILDFYYLSKFCKTPGLRDIPGEIRLLKQFFEVLRKIYGNIPIYFKIGNHEERYYKYLADKAPELFGMPEIQFDNIFETDKYGVELIDDKRVMRAGKLNIIHGHELPMSSGGINVARNVRLKTLENTLCGHFHKKQDDDAPTVSGKTQGGFSVGCLCGLNPPYMPINQWTHGCAIIQTDDDGAFEVSNKRIINGKIK